MILQSFVTFKDKPKSESIRSNKVLIADEEVTKVLMWLLLKSACSIENYRLIK